MKGRMRTQWRRRFEGGGGREGLCAAETGAPTVQP